MAESSIFFIYYFSILMKSILIEFSVPIRPNSLERFVIVRMGFSRSFKIFRNKIFRIECDTYIFFLLLLSLSMPNKVNGKFQDLNRNPFLKFREKRINLLFSSYWLVYKLCLFLNFSCRFSRNFTFLFPFIFYFLKMHFIENWFFWKASKD